MPQLIIDFTGGIEDGQTTYLDTESGDQHEASLAGSLYASLKEIEGTDQAVILTVPSPAGLKQARREGWNRRQRHAKLPIYGYAVTGWLEGGDEVYVHAKFVGANRLSNLI